MCFQWYCRAQRNLARHIFQMNCLSKKSLNPVRVWTVIKARLECAGDERHLSKYSYISSYYSVVSETGALLYYLKFRTNALQPQIFSDSFIKILFYWWHILNIDISYIVKLFASTLLNQRRNNIFTKSTLVLYNFKHNILQITYFSSLFPSCIELWQ